MVVFNGYTSISKKNILRLPVPVSCEESEVVDSSFPFHLIPSYEIPGMYFNSVAGAVEILMQVFFFKKKTFSVLCLLVSRGKL